jgi:hypothetical protein
MSGPMCLGQHAMLRFPERPGSGLISTSSFAYGQVFVETTERPENRGYSILKPGAEFASLTNVATITCEVADLTQFSARRGFEDIGIIISQSGLEAKAAPSILNHHYLPPITLVETHPLGSVWQLERPL